jgi:hypothetical protein
MKVLCFAMALRELASMNGVRDSLMVMYFLLASEPPSPRAQTAGWSDWRRESGVVPVQLWNARKNEFGSWGPSRNAVSL